MLVARWFFEHLYDARIAPSMICIDKETETGKMITMHCYLRNLQGAENSSFTVVYGQSTSNQVSVALTFITTVNHVLMIVCFENQWRNAAYEF